MEEVKSSRNSLKLGALIKRNVEQATVIIGGNATRKRYRLISRGRNSATLTRLARAVRCPANPKTLFNYGGSLPG